MLSKLLKYDFKSVFKYWWIAAVSSLALSILGGGCITLIGSDRELPSIVYGTAIFALVIIILSIAVFSVLSLILILVRFYKNFFTDEGYLTFTLPVRRSQLLNSKLIMSTSSMIITFIICVVDILAMLLIGFADEIFTKEFFKSVSEVFDYLVSTFGYYLIIYIVEIIGLMILSVIFSNLFLFACITFASIITRKAKVITAIGIYYGANCIIQFAMQIFYLFGLSSIVNWFGILPEGSGNLIASLVLLGIIFFMAMLCALLYSLEYWMLDRKLNLS